MTLHAQATLDAQTIQAAVDAAHRDNVALQGGANASYIPYLASVDSSLFGVAVVTAEGEVYSAGDADFEFAIESISKVFTMARAMADVGPVEFHQKIGADPTGLPFNSVMALELHNDKPLSPLVNAGAMSSASLVKAADTEQRWQRILETQRAFAGREVQLSPEVNTSEQTTNFHNRAIAWLLYSGGAMYSDPMEACDVYTRQCSTLISVKDLATMGATIASGGVNPVTGERVVDAELVPHMLAEMTMEGLYTSSGDWAYTVGLPGKSGVGGGVLSVAPGKLAIAAFSPPLDPVGNSVRGMAAVGQVAQRLDLSLYKVPGAGDPPLSALLKRA
ncbi:glutaminase A [Cellulomonas chengniuliangii]|uniref:Glutaminase n=1 Tax=Cellulomonas chengniuliangii TaxID=2968084 RepID=A0ABY5KZZ7_9CELL|nr:glutaminase A [Cellulomonas chengniuliangii]MCC2309729.1 glutaminase A [Cellulomonas chengniuliangii]MCC2319025.1 glutaminase A [Cellulomonas chengniuliangii]UUI74725.1 glutaminase A [Cellulomonas chengniuliangii]